VIFDTLSTGASDDILRASKLARRMVTEYGIRVRSTFVEAKISAPWTTKD
jgi:ATP-dependent Zn protease